jgi:hypothetical protein
MTAGFRITSGIFALLATALWHFDYPRVFLFFIVIAILLLLTSLFTHRSESKTTDINTHAPAPTVKPDALIVSKLSHPDLRERDHRASVLGCTIFNKSGQKGAITKVSAYDKRDNLMNVTWSKEIDDFGNPINPCELIGIIDQTSLFVRANDGKEIEFCKLDIFHTFFDSPITATFDEYADGWKLS